MKKLLIALILMTGLAFSQVGAVAVIWDTSAAVSSAVEVGTSEKPIILSLPYQAGETTVYTFQVSYDLGGTYYDLYEMDGTEVSITIDTTKAQAIALKPILFAGVSYIKVRRGTSGSVFSSGTALTGYIWRRDY